VIFCHQLFFRPIIGLADNGDYERVTDHLHLAPEPVAPEDRYFFYVLGHYRTAPPVGRRNVSSEVILAAAARLAALPFSPRGTFDLRWMGAIHLLALLGAGVVLWNASRGLATGARVAAGAFAVFAFTDVGYAAPFNSFYTQEASLIFFFWAAAMAAVSIADGRRRRWPIAGYFAAALLLVASKPQEAMQSVPLALFGLYLAWRPGRRRIAGAGALLLFIAAGGLYRGTSADGGFQQQMLYKIVFSEILPRSPDPAGDLRAMGLDPAAARYSGTTSKGPHSPFQDPRVHASLFPKLGYRALLRLYFERPARAAAELVRGAPAGLELRAEFGNFEKSAGFRPGARSAAYSGWTKIRVLALAGRLPSPVRASLATLVAMGVLAFAVCTLMASHIELSRKLYLFHAITDLLIGIDLALAGRAVAARRATALPLPAALSAS
jgi:hypothetical protein